MKWHRIHRRLRLHHLPLAVSSSAAVLAIYMVLDAEDVIFKLSMATAYPGMALLGLTLVTGAWRVIRRRPNPVSDDLTRDIGLWAGAISLIHVGFGLNVHLRGQMLRLFVPENPTFPYIRLDQFGAANETGLIATLIIIMLLALSNDLSLRKLRTRRWKALQRWNYALFGVVIVHGILYQLIEGRAAPFIVAFAAIAAIVVVFQLTGFLARRRRQDQKAA